MKRLILLAVVSFAAALVVPTIGAAKKNTGNTTKVNVVLKASDLVLVDAKGDGASAGDVYTFTLTLFDKSGKKQTGKGHGYCVLGAPNFSTCTTVTDDGKGKIVTVFEDDGIATTPEEIAVLGGTRAYRNVHGDGTSTEIDPTTFKVKLTLTR
jgi:type II secretory pathway pseudopilin PulG